MYNGTSRRIGDAWPFGAVRLSRSTKATAVRLTVIITTYETHFYRDSFADRLDIQIVHNPTI